MKPLGTLIMEEVRRYNDGNGCTRRQLVDAILVAVDQQEARTSTDTGEVAALRATLEGIEQCALGIMPTHRDMAHLMEIIIDANDARWTRLYAILSAARAALGREG